MENFWSLQHCAWHKVIYFRHRGVSTVPAVYVYADYVLDTSTIYLWILVSFCEHGVMC